ncbi:tyrosine protein phosphatase [Aquibacillus sp. LR5S19]|uniref:Tyrosine-protein phosphatase n=1 Tax=Aquibacillus rhizosphaerae TaxID=3051431 RepID=A0ABT7KZP8_9BACI|nr:CpsB/CapC family capsule biosynthesis tyrosine phosphatase [Aquibacillus sp. LR5S19]MDL4838948.1 tyrosine protein phosphatase [Aquibacillus sp. LR5S19]
MIDVHCNILPGADDGSRHMEESVAMAKEAINQGIDTVIATPHHMDGKYHNFKHEILKYVKDLNDRLQSEGIPLTVLPGQNIRIYGELLDSFKQDHLLELNENSGYLMIELPINHIPQYTNQLIFDLQIQGYRPIIVHPELHEQFIDDPNPLYELVKNGALVQIGAGSIIGKNGKKVQKFVHQLINANLAHFLGSEAHDHNNYSFQQAVREVRKKYGNGTVYLFTENALLLIKGETVIADQPTRIKKKKILGLI